MSENSNQGCILCGENSLSGMHLKGQRMIHGKTYTYQLCKSCCLTNHEYSEDGLSRKILWMLVDEQLVTES